MNVIEYYMRTADVCVNDNGRLGEVRVEDQDGQP